VPAPFALPAGCRFHPRCVFADPGCAQQDPTLRPVAELHQVACLHAPVEQFVA
jgi:oligopeptide/dipeptide ABC transporter ATP-binding protein